LFPATSKKDLRPQVFSSGARPQAARWDNDKRAGRSRSAGKYWFLFYCVV
tara:strand:- start:173 stop:322 length:150 start_codon:yes stop_codon:yes gene_type:complete